MNHTSGYPIANGLWRSPDYLDGVDFLCHSTKVSNAAEAHEEGLAWSV